LLRRGKESNVLLAQGMGIELLPERVEGNVKAPRKRRRFLCLGSK